VVTKDLIDDIGYVDTSDVLNFVGMNSNFEGEALQMRGYKTGYSLVDDMPENQNYQDNFWVDTYTVIKGAAQFLYINVQVSGTVIKSSKKPLPFEQDIVTASYNDAGTFRFTFDSTGPIGTVAGARLSYRVAAVDQGGNNYYQNVDDNRKGLFGEFEARLNQGVVRVWYMIQHLKHYAQADGILTPQGALYTGSGSKFANFPPNDMVDLESKRVKFELDQHIFNNWEMRLSAGNWNYHYQNTPYIYTNSPLDWSAGTVGFQSIENNESINYWGVIDDFSGHYNLGQLGSLGPIKNSDAFGFGYEDNLSIPKQWFDNSFGSAGTLVVPFLSAQAINAIRVPTYADFPIPANEGTHLETLYSQIYWQHNIEIIPDRLILSAGFTWSNIDLISNFNISALPPTATQLSVSQLLHHIGAVLKITREISLYCLNSTTFTPPTGTAPILTNFTSAPPQKGLDNEVGIKTSFLDGRLSTDFSWFQMTLSDNLVNAGSINGTSVNIDVGTGKQEGVDGDVQFSVLPGLQVIGAFYAGHDRDYLNVPISNSYDNSWSFFSRYNFAKDTVLHALSLGTGISRVGGRWISTSGLVNSTGLETSYTRYTASIVQPNGSPETGEIKVQTGTEWNGFASYQLNRHWLVRLSIDNILNERFPRGEQNIVIADYAQPLLLNLMTVFKF